MYNRILSQELLRLKGLFRVVTVTGPRQSGKTTLIRHLLTPYGDKVLWLNGDNPDAKNLLSGEGIRVSSVHSGKELLLFLKKNCKDLSYNH